MAAAAAFSSSSSVSERRGDSKRFIRRRCPDVSHTSRPQCELCPCISSRKVWEVKATDLSISHVHLVDHAWRRVERSKMFQGCATYGVTNLWQYYPPFSCSDEQPRWKS